MDNAEQFGKKMSQDSYHGAMRNFVIPETNLCRYHATKKPRSFKSEGITSNAEGIAKSTSEDGFHDSLIAKVLQQQSMQQQARATD